MQERSHAYALKSQIWLLDPRPNLPTLVRMVEEGFELSEASNTPVMLEIRIRTCHVHGQFVCKDNRKPSNSRCARRWRIRCATSIGSCCRPLRSCTRRRSSSAAGRRRSNSSSRASSTRSSAPPTATSASSCWAACTTTTMRALEYLGLADAYGEFAVPLYVLNVAYPADRGRAHRILPRQERRADGRGGRARLYRARSQYDPAPARSSDKSLAARTCCRWAANTPRRC